VSAAGDASKHTRHIISAAAAAADEELLLLLLVVLLAAWLSHAAPAAAMAVSRSPAE
jgi:hypothetical protein